MNTGDKVWRNLIHVRYYTGLVFRCIHTQSVQNDDDATMVWRRDGSEGKKITVSYNYNTHACTRLTDLRGIATIDVLYHRCVYSSIVISSATAAVCANNENRTEHPCPQREIIDYPLSKLFALNLNRSLRTSKLCFHYVSLNVYVIASIGILQSWTLNNILYI